MRDLNVTLVQSHLQWQDAAANRAHFSQIIADLKQPTDLIVLPEMFTTGFTMNVADQAENMGDTSVAWLKQMAETYNVTITGSIIITEDGQYYNRLIWMPPNGQVAYYNKRHLFRMGREHEHYTPGQNRLIVSCHGWQICPLVCYDLRFPVWSRNRQEYDLLLYVANWPARRRYAWQTLLKARAIENLSYVVGVNRVGDDGEGIHYSGDSAALNYLGEELVAQADAPLITTVSLNYEELQNYRARFPAHLDADEFELR